MEYIDIFNFPGWTVIGVSVFQTATLFFLILIGLKLVGRRVFAQRGPQDLIIVVLVAEACDLGLTDERAGYWGTVASVITLFILGYLSEKIPFIRKNLKQDPVLLYSGGRLHRKEMRRNMIDEDELNEVAREHGFLSYKDLDAMILEDDGNVSAVSKATIAEPKQS